MIGCDRVKAWLRKLRSYLKFWLIDCTKLPESWMIANHCHNCGREHPYGKFKETRQGWQPLIVCKCGFIMISWGFEKEQILRIASLRNF